MPQLIGEQQLAMKIDPAAPLKDPKDYTIVGTSVPRRDIPDKIFGTFNFVQDHKLPGMLHARVVHPAGVRSTLQSFDDTACRKIKGYVRAVRKGNLLAVVATNEWAAISASKAIVAKWSDWAGLPVESQLYEYVRSSKVDRNEVLQTAGDTAAGFKQGKRTLQATYDFAMQTHGSIGPSCAVADFKDGRLTVWTPSQASHLLQVQLATMLSLKPENVRCIFVEGAGCYGRNGADDCTSEAAVIAREIGKPVRLQWMRQDEHGWDPKGPPVVLDYRASIDDQGQITAWESDMFMPEQPFKRSGVTLLAAVLAGLPKMPLPGSATPHSGLGIPYALPNNKLTVHWLLDTPLPSAWIRAPGNTQNTFGNETFLDEIAAATGVDPFEIRVRHLEDSRGLEVLERLRALAKWEPRGSRPRDAGAIARGRGVTYSKYESVRTYVAVVADVTVDRTTGRDKSRSRVRRARLRPDHQSRRPAQSDRRQRRANGEPQRGREGHVQPQRGHQPQLGKLPDPDVPQCARGCHRPDRPAERGSLGCGRADDIPHPFGDRECSVRRDRCVGAIRTVQTRPGAGGIETRKPG